MDAYIAVDVGGTQIRVSVFPAEGTKPLRQEKISTRDVSRTATERLIDLVARLWPEDATVRSIGLAAPGPTDPKAGVVIAAPNIKEWVNFPLQQILQDRFHVPVLLGNDANLAALGEWKYGAAVGYHHVVFLTISTGIGGGIIIDDRLLLGERGLAAECGHVIIDPDGPLCNCGGRGHLEALSSGTAIARYVADELKKGRPSKLPLDPPPTSRDIFKAAQTGDALSIEAFARAGHYLGLFIASLAHTFNPSIVVLGGGVSQTRELLINPLWETLRKNVMAPDYIKDLVITTAALGDDAGLYGALALAQQVK
ncbi:MAG TPA: ROK family protein [Anaerolineaceae bacterium]|nr:ROK family protein [Anaerolineaceae bacterium]HPN50766.1 ROK family protein [Anaerolineaceae bacterium]